jgi:hypothetical protein
MTNSFQSVTNFPKQQAKKGWGRSQGRKGSKMPAKE